MAIPSLSNADPSKTYNLNVTEEELFVLSKWAVLAANSATATEDLHPAISLSEKVDRLMDQVPVVRRPR